MTENTDYNAGYAAGARRANEQNEYTIKVLTDALRWYASGPSLGIIGVEDMDLKSDGFHIHTGKRARAALKKIGEKND